MAVEQLNSQTKLREKTKPSHLEKTQSAQQQSLAYTDALNLKDLAVSSLDRNLYSNLSEAKLNRKLPLPSVANSIVDLDVHTSRVVWKLNYIDELVDDYEDFLKAESEKLVCALRKADRAELDISEYQLEQIAEKSTHIKIRADLNDILDHLPEAERQSILNISKSRNYSNILKTLGCSLDKRHVGKELSEQCSLIQEALTLHVFCKLNADNLQLVSQV